MELSDRSYHKRLIEMCDCYLETAFSDQMKAIAQSDSADPEEDAIRYLALAIMQGISEKAGKLSFKKKDGATSIILKNEEKTPLPVPGDRIVDNIFSIMKSIIHLEGKKMETVLSIGLRNDQIELNVEMEIKDDRQSLKLKFPAS